MRAAIRSLMVLLLCISAQTGLAASLGSTAMNTDGLQLDLNSVERRGNVLTVKWSVKNSGQAATRLRFRLTGKHVTTYAVDEESGTKYYVLTDKEGNSLASQHVYIGSDDFGIDDAVEAGQTKRYWMKLPSPPPAVKSINLMFTDSEPFESVAITDK